MCDSVLLPDGREIMTRGELEQAGFVPVSHPVYGDEFVGTPDDCLCTLDMERTMEGRGFTFDPGRIPEWQPTSPTDTEER